MQKLKYIALLLSLCPLWVGAQYRSAAWSPDNGDGTYTNPVLYADYSDPDVYAVGEDYYLPHFARGQSVQNAPLPCLCVHCSPAQHHAYCQ